MRQTVRQAGAAVPVRILVESLGTDWLTVLEASDFSVPDPQRRFPGARDPADDERRIQPGFALIEAPLMFFNGGTSAVTLEVSILREDGTRVQQAMIGIISQETYLHPAPGQRMLKRDPATAHGDRMQVKASAANAVQLTSTASEGAAEQHDPEAG
jgi:hypothetical protein